MSGDPQADGAMLRARVADLRDQGMTYRAIGAELGINASTAWRHHEEWIKELRRGDPELQERAKEAIRRQHAMLQQERERLELERTAALEVLTARHLTISNGVLIRDENKVPLEDDGPVLQALSQLQAIRDRLIKLADHEAKLLGLYAEQKVNLSGGIKYEVVGVSEADL